MKQFLQPPPGQRTFSLLFLVFVGTWSAVVTIIWVTARSGEPVDSGLLFGLAGLVGSVNIPLITGQAYKSVQTARAQSGNYPQPANIPQPPAGPTATVQVNTGDTV